MELNVPATTAQALAKAAGQTLDTLKAAGRLDLSPEVFLVAACDPGARRRVYRFTLVEVSPAGGAHLADLVSPEDRELLPALHGDREGTFLQRQTGERAAQDEQFAQERFKHRFLLA